ncbi:SPOR domain-containing protein [Dietzia cinnamea]|uniref:SPOR domain-containing protein n=1 Tax=Dietzia TaxID=37914 RepID=UPI00101AD375|nr:MULTISPECIES: SPOR domain-containing protein [Dietzia]MCT1710754.1 SPOR domain-containing protein [Dietzia cinnamea]MCT2264594.1 SPOR domain-containing protein [Dietzia cinnamea]
MSEEQWYYDIATGQALQGKVTNWDSRMGPYATRAEAEAALAKARARNEAWDAEDEKD